MKYSNLVERIAGDGADAWEIHYAARAAQDRGEDVIILSVGDPDIETPQPVIERAIECLRERRYALHAGGRVANRCARPSPPRIASAPARPSKPPM